MGIRIFQSRGYNNVPYFDDTTGRYPFNLIPDSER